MVHEVRIPRLNVNEDEVLVTDVLVSVGERVEKGQELFVVETTKASVSVEAALPGYIRSKLVEVGRPAKVGAVACVISDAPEEPLPDIHSSQTLVEESKRARAAGIFGAATAKQRLEARRAGAGATTNPDPDTSEAAMPSFEIVASENLPWVREIRSALADLAVGESDMPARTHSKLPVAGTEDARDVSGTYVGAGATLGKGSAVRARRFYIGQGAQIGNDCYIEADSVYIGAATKIGDHAHIVTGELLLDAGIVIGDQVGVDVAGGRSSESRLLVGAGSLIASGALINTAREVVLEREAAVSPGAMLFTHGFWQSVLEGYPAIFSGVRVCENAWIGAGCQILPGVKIGRGSVVISNSTVIGAVPEFALVGGVPAKVLRGNIRRQLNPNQKDRILQKILRDFIGNLEFKGCKVENTAGTNTFLITLPDGRKRSLILLTSEESALPAIPPASILITFGQDVPLSPKLSIFDLAKRQFEGAEDRLTHELRNFLRRRGIRFQPFTWDAGFEHGL